MVAEFLGEAIILPARVAAGHAHCILGAIPVDRDENRQTAEILLRPEQVGLGPDQTGGASAMVTDSEFSGPTCMLTVEVANGAGEAGTLVLRQPSAGAPQVGTRIRLTVSGSAHLLN
ncbi:TOBE domain-containing protein [Aquamicrobium lusatiense]|uniref:TOBE domain-containing protein n=1 Tax=Aquamicrobium lusatiense TaxID=89772 RepID=UPI003CC80E0B